MSTAVDVYTDDLTDVDFRIEQPCEHRNHNWRTDVHEGPGYYYVVGHCPHCGRASGILLYCKKVIETVVSVRCGACNTTSPRKEFWTVVGTIEG